MNRYKDTHRYKDSGGENKRFQEHSPSAQVVPAVVSTFGSFAEPCRDVSYRSPAVGLSRHLPGLVHLPPELLGAKPWLW